MSSLRFLAAAFAVILLTALAASATPAAVWNFDATPTGSAVPLALTSNGIVATFDSPDGAVFSVAPAFLFAPPLGGNVLADFDANPYALTIAFSQTVSSISMDFALDLLGGPDALLFLTAFRSNVAVGHTSAVGAFPPAAFFEQGTLLLSHNLGFDSVLITSSRDNFAVDNVAVTVPEPAALKLLVMGLTLLLLTPRPPTPV